MPLTKMPWLEHILPLVLEQLVLQYADGVSLQEMYRSGWKIRLVSVSGHAESPTTYHHEEACAVASYFDSIWKGVIVVIDTDVTSWFGTASSHSWGICRCNKLDREMYIYCLSQREERTAANYGRKVCEVLKFVDIRRFPCQELTGTTFRSIPLCQPFKKISHTWNPG